MTDQMYKGVYYDGGWIKPEDGVRLANLNDLCIPSADGPDEPLPNRKLAKISASITPVFRDIEGFLVDKVADSSFVFGCIAWLTNERFLEACQSLDGCCFVVQKEDFLRPDSFKSRGIRKLYGKLPALDTKYCTPFGIYNYCGEDGVGKVRCVGNYNKDKNPAFPRMHNKFIIFCDKNEKFDWENFGENEECYFSPKSVWTGSFNVTHNASNSLENGVYIESDEIAEIYMEELVAIYGLSEPLDWRANWVYPEHRIGS